MLILPHHRHTASVGSLSSSTRPTYTPSRPSGATIRNWTGYETPNGTYEPWGPFYGVALAKQSPVPEDPCGLPDVVYGFDDGIDVGFPPVEVGKAGSSGRSGGGSRGGGSRGGGSRGGVFRGGFRRFGGIPTVINNYQINSAPCAYVDPVTGVCYGRDSYGVLFPL